MKCLVWIIGLMFALPLHAQRFNVDDLFLAKGNFNISGSYAIPVMDFGLAKITNASGYANPGYQIKAGIGFEVSRSVGLNLMYLYNSNPYNDAQFSKDFEPFSSTIFRGTHFRSVQTDPWAIHGMMVGIFYPFRTVNTTYEIRFNVGFLSSVLPKQDFNLALDSSNRPVTMRIDEVGSNGLAYQVGIAVRHRIFENWLLIGHADFLYSEQTYNNISIHLLGSYALYPWASDYTQYFHVVGLGLGIAYQFQ